MKNTLLGLIMVMAISSGLALAQRPGPGDSARGPQAGPQKRIDFLAARLNLTDSQKQQATSIFNAEEEATKKLRESLEQAHKGLANAVKTRATDDQIDRLAGTMGTLVGQLTATQMKATTKFQAILTEEQRQKFDQLPGPGAGMMRGFAGGPPPPPGMGMMRGFAGGPPPGMGMMPGFAGGSPPEPPPSSEEAHD
jgi:Spy/CpxP family protein refolding chaperone